MQVSIIIIIIISSIRLKGSSFFIFKFSGTFQQFLDEDFDAKTYANGIIQARIIDEALAKLADGVSLLDKELHDQVIDNFARRGSYLTLALLIGILWDLNFDLS